MSVSGIVLGVGDYRSEYSMVFVFRGVYSLVGVSEGEVDYLVKLMVLIILIVVEV